jgi:hypothetical protein
MQRVGTLARLSLAAGALLSLFPAAGAADDEAGPCYLRFTGIGRTTALCSQAPPRFEELKRLHIPLPDGGETPEIHLLRYAFTTEMVFFDRECNRRRYARTDFSCANGNLWYQDSRDQWVEAARVCTGGACQREGGPCRSAGDCCKGYRCHSKLRTCEGPAEAEPPPPVRGAAP